MRKLFAREETQQLQVLVEKNVVRTILSQRCNFYSYCTTVAKRKRTKVIVRALYTVSVIYHDDLGCPSLLSCVRLTAHGFKNKVLAKNSAYCHCMYCTPPNGTRLKSNHMRLTLDEV